MGMDTNINTDPKKQAATSVTLVTGAAGFIGYHLSEYLLIRGDQVIGIDNLNDYYDVNLKLARLERLKKHKHFTFKKIDLIEKDSLVELFEQNKINKVVNLAAQAGVRYSVDNPDCYVQSNVVGFLNILECCRHFDVKHLVFASSSSVYGANTKQPFSESDSTDHPLSLYAASKKSNELMAHAYASLYDLPVTGLRFFTVYGPWGRPDMALFKFTKNILEGKPIDVYNYGNMVRDFTYISDIIDGVVRVLDYPEKLNNQPNTDASDSPTKYAPYQIYNIGSSVPINLMTYINQIETLVNKKANCNFLPIQLADVLKSHSDVSKIHGDVGYSPIVSVKEGVAKFVKWYVEYYQVPISKDLRIEVT